jgi:DNA-binding response OmpR family regulator
VSLPRVFVVSTAPEVVVRAAGALTHVRRPNRRGDDPGGIVACDVHAFTDIEEACSEMLRLPPAVVVLLLKESAPADCVRICAQVQASLPGTDTPLAVIFPSTDPRVWQEVYATGANMFLPWHGAVLEGLPTYVGSLLPEDVDPQAQLSRRGLIVLDERRCLALIRDYRAEFTALQFRILRHLVRNTGRLCTREELTRVLHDPPLPDRTPITGSLYEHISQIRKRLGPHKGIVRCIRRRGYLLDPRYVAA